MATNQKKKSIFSRLFGGKKLDPDKLRSELRTEMRGLQENLYGLEYDLKKTSKDRQRIIQRGTKAHNNGDQVAVQEAAQELKYLNAEIANIQQYRANIVKTRLLCRVSMRSLESTLPGGAMDAAVRIMNLMEDEDLNNMLMNKECSEEAFQDVLDRKLSTMMRGIEARSHGEEHEISDEVNLFANLADAEKEGDETKVKEIMAKMTGETSGKADFDIT